MLGKIDSRRRRRHKRMRWLDGINDGMDMNLGKLQETVRDSTGHLESCYLMETHPVIDAKD